VEKMSGIITAGTLKEREIKIIHQIGQARITGKAIPGATYIPTTPATA
jgi:hypothetical protein